MPVYRTTQTHQVILIAILGFVACPARSQPPMYTGENPAEWTDPRTSGKKAPHNVTIVAWPPDPEAPKRYKKLTNAEKKLAKAIQAFDDIPTIDNDFIAHQLQAIFALSLEGSPYFNKKQAGRLNKLKKVLGETNRTMAEASSLGGYEDQVNTLKPMLPESISEGSVKKFFLNLENPDPDEIDKIRISLMVKRVAKNEFMVECKSKNNKGNWVPLSTLTSTFQRGGLLTIDGATPTVSAPKSAPPVPDQ